MLTVQFVTENECYICNSRVSHYLRLKHCLPLSKLLWVFTLSRVGGEFIQYSTIALYTVRVGGRFTQYCTSIKHNFFCDNSDNSLMIITSVIDVQIKLLALVLMEVQNCCSLLQHGSTL